MTRLLPPIADQKPHSATYHGVTREDPYTWLRADNWQEVMQAPETLPADIRAYLEAENAFFEQELGEPTKALQDKIFWEIRGRIKEDDSSIPTPDGPWAYNSRMLEGQQYPLLVRTPREGGAETVLLDCNQEAGDGYFGFAGAEHDPSHRLLAWGADRAGSEFYTLHIRDLETGLETADQIEKTAGGFEWSSDSRLLFYTELDENHRPFRVRRHRLGTPQSADEIVYEEADPGFFVGVGKTLSNRFIVIDAHDHQTSECWLLDGHGEGTPRLVAERVEGREYDIDERDGTLFIRTNADGAEDFKIVTAPADDPGHRNWTDLIAHREGVLITDAIVLKGHMLRLERFEGLPRIVVRDLGTGAENTVRFAEEAYALGMSVGYEFDTTVFRLTYSSPTTPSRTYDFDLLTGERTLLKEQELPSGHNPTDYVTRRIFATAPDGETVPITILHKAGLPIDGTAPCFVYGYGAYGMSLPASFSVSPLSLVDRGMVYAVIHVRGGMEKGYRWYRLGRHKDKRNTFTDFIAATEHLVKEGYAAPGRIVAEGGSAGGMLMGAIANMRPDLYAGILAIVPFVDVLNTMLDETLPLTPPEWPEWGNPLASPEDYKRIASYAPYEQVTAQPYPAIFVMAGLTDPRVTYWEPAKWVAKLRATKTGDSPLILKTNMDAGHGGASGRFDRLKETALAYAFALVAADIEKSGASG